MRVELDAVVETAIDSLPACYGSTAESPAAALFIVSALVVRSGAAGTAARIGDI